MTKEAVIELVDEQAIIYDGLDAAIIGVAERCGMPNVVTYDYDKLIEELIKTYDNVELSEYDINQEMTVEDKKFEMAVEWYDYNINGGYVGEYTPIIVRTKFD